MKEGTVLGADDVGHLPEHETLPDTAASLCRIKQEFEYLLKISLLTKQP
jgi:hypothetical protein